MRALVVGGGSWGTAFAGVLARRGHEVELACRDAAGGRRSCARERENRATCRASALEDGVTPVLLDLPRQAPGRDLIALALPAAAYAETAAALRLRQDALVITLAKGLDPGDAPAAARTSSSTPRGTIRPRVAPLSGPNHAEEIAAGQPAASVIASSDADVARPCSGRSRPTRFRVYASGDVRGVQLCGAAKNVIGIAAGICDGLGFGDNARARP